MESQIKVRDLSGAKLSIEPADATSWSEVRTELIAEAKNALRAELELELSAAADESAVEGLRKAFSAKERTLETSIDTKVHTFSATVDVEVSSRPLKPLSQTDTAPPNASASPWVRSALPLASQYNFLAK